MKTFGLLLCAVALLVCGCSPSLPGNSKNFVAFTGQSIIVRIDDQPTTKMTEPLVMVDKNGVQGRKATWQAATASSTGRPCFQFDVTPQAKLGTIKSVDLQIIEYRPDREHYQWRTFKSHPNPSDKPPYTGMLMSAGQKYCPNQFSLNYRLRFERLPAGDYYLGMRVNGASSWDVQEIFLRVN